MTGVHDLANGNPPTNPDDNAPASPKPSLDAIAASKAAGRNGVA